MGERDRDKLDYKGDLEREGMPAELPPDDNVIPFSVFEDFAGTQPLPEGYNPDRDLFLLDPFSFENAGDVNKINMQGANQCDARIGFAEALLHPEKFERFLRKRGQAKEEE